MNAGAWAVVIAALIAAVVAPWAKALIDRRSRQRDEERADKATIAVLVDNNVDRLFRETEQLREAYREDLADVRRQLAESNQRVTVLEQEVAEWRAGVRGVVGVWVAVPASVWEYVRSQLPDLPLTRFPGERPQEGLTDEP